MWAKWGPRGLLSIEALQLARSPRTRMFSDLSDVLMFAGPERLGTLHILPPVVPQAHLLHLRHPLHRRSVGRVSSVNMLGGPLATKGSRERFPSGFGRNACTEEIVRACRSNQAHVSD